MVALKEHANPERAGFAKKYMREQFEFIGLDARSLRNTVDHFTRVNGYPEMEDLESFSLSLWELPEREFQYTVIQILQKLLKKLRKQDINWIMQLIVRKSWWDTVDGLAAWICGSYFRKYPEQIKPVTENWMNSENLWLQRSALLFQLKYKLHTDTELLGNYIERLADHKDFFIRKAIGWVLREYSKSDKQWVKTFLIHHDLPGLSVREASKYLD
jgi:3-methyladenine DNA glycosylase AlkD